MRFDMNVLLYAALEGLRSYSYSADRVISVAVVALISHVSLIAQTTSTQL